MRTAEDLPHVLKAGRSHRLHMPGVWIIHGEYSTSGAETGLLSMVSKTAGIHLGAACTMPVCTSHPPGGQTDLLQKALFEGKTVKSTISG